MMPPSPSCLHSLTSPKARLPFSSQHFASPSETVLFLDWDDTLFPTSELFDTWGLSLGNPQVPRCLIGKMRLWRSRLASYLSTAMDCSDCVRIITSSRPPWVEECVKQFAPELTHVLSGKGRIKIVYALDELPQRRRLLQQCMDLRPVRHRESSMSLTNDERATEATLAKRNAMRRECREFFSRYPGQTWKNIISIGDSMYEHDALQDMTFLLPPEHDVRTKTIVLPTAPTLSQIASRLQFSTIFLPRYVDFDGDIDLNLQSPGDPLAAIGDALNIPLATLPVSRHAWGFGSKPTARQVRTETKELRAAIAGCKSHPCSSGGRSFAESPGK